MDHLHSSANSNVLKSTASPEVLEAALEAAERLKRDEVHEQDAARDDSDKRAPPAQPKAQAAVRAPKSVDDDAPRSMAAAAAAPLSAAPQPDWQAAAALADAGRDGMRAWLELAQRATYTNVEVLCRLPGCRTWLDLASLQSSALQQRLRDLMDFGEALARASETLRLAARQAPQPIS